MHHFCCNYLKENKVSKSKETKKVEHAYHFCHAMLCKRGLSRHAVSVCVCVCLSITYVDSVKTNQHIFKLFSPLGSHTILVFFHTKRNGNILTGTFLTTASNAGGVGKNRDAEPISGFTVCREPFQRQVQYN